MPDPTSAGAQTVVDMWERYMAGIATQAEVGRTIHFLRSRLRCEEEPMTSDPTPAAAHTVKLYLPWHAEADHDLGGVPYWLILDSAGLPRASGMLPEEAAVIVQAVNERATLVAALEAVERGIISYGSGPVAPCFDQDDYEIERHRGSWTVVDHKAIEQVRAALTLARGGSDGTRFQS